MNPGSSESEPIFWVVSSLDELGEFPLEVRDTVGFTLFQAQCGSRHPDTKILKGFGSVQVLEVVENHSGDTYRAVYTVKFAGIVYALHAFQKKSKSGVQTPKHEIDLIHARLAWAKAHYEGWQNEQNSQS